MALFQILLLVLLGKIKSAVFLYIDTNGIFFVLRTIPYLANHIILFQMESANQR